MELSFFDYSFFLMQDKSHHLDFVSVIQLAENITVSHLEEGARLAYKTFPRTGSIVRNKKFQYLYKDINIIVQNSEDLNGEIYKFINTAIDIKYNVGLQQMFCVTKYGNFLITRFHHALGDYVSLLQWLEVQFLHKIRSEVTCVFFEELSKRPIHTIYKYRNKIKGFKLEPKKEIPSPNRNYIRIELLKHNLDYKNLGFSYNDLLSYILFKSLRDLSYELNHQEIQLCLYIPVNLRSDPFQGFGNGCSRFKIYDNGFDWQMPQKCILKIREQMNWCRKNNFAGSLNKLKLLKYLPDYLNKLIVVKLGLKLSEPGSAIFTHIESVGPYVTLNQYCKNVFTVSQLHSSYNIAFSATTNDDLTNIVITWRESSFTFDHMNSLKRILKDNYIDTYDKLSLNDQGKA